MIVECTLQSKRVDELVVECTKLLSIAYGGPKLYKPFKEHMHFYDGDWPQPERMGLPASGQIVPGIKGTIENKHVTDPELAQILPSPQFHVGQTLICLVRD